MEKLPAVINNEVELSTAFDELSNPKFIWGEYQEIRINDSFWMKHPDNFDWKNSVILRCIMLKTNGVVRDVKVERDFDTAFGQYVIRIWGYKKLLPKESETKKLDHVRRISNS